MLKRVIDEVLLSAQAKIFEFPFTQVLVDFNIMTMLSNLMFRVTNYWFFISDNPLSEQ
jgi:hypothetical protein